MNRRLRHLCRNSLSIGTGELARPAGDVRLNTATLTWPEEIDHALRIADHIGRRTHGSFPFRNPPLRGRPLDSGGSFRPQHCCGGKNKKNTHNIEFMALPSEIATDDAWMRCALALAAEAEASGEVPVGCVLVANGEMIGQGRNSPIQLLDPTAHAEMLALRQGALALSNYRLEEATLYCTLEPCVMCAGALVAARVRRLVFGARDLRFGGIRSKFQIADSPLLNHRVEITEGILGAEATAMLHRFFARRRGPVVTLQSR